MNFDGSAFYFFAELQASHVNFCVIVKNNIKPSQSWPILTGGSKRLVSVNKLESWVVP